MNANLFPAYVTFADVTPDDFRTLVTLVHKNAWALYIGVGGDVSITGSNGTTCLFKNVPSGTLLPIKVSQVKLTGTTATNIIALYGGSR